MATLGDSLSSSIGKSWSTWSDCIKNKQSNDVGSSNEEKKPKVESDSMKLRSEDMPLYGFCPAQDEFFLVVCERCGQVIKPQALQRHIELRHDKSKKSKSPGSSHKSGHFRARSSKHSPTKEGEVVSVVSHEASDHPAHTNTKNHTIPFVKVERMSSEKISQNVTSVEPNYDKPKLSFKETYKEQHLEGSTETCSENTMGYVSVKEETCEPQVYDITVKQEPVFEELSSDYKEEPGGNKIVTVKLENSPPSGYSVADTIVNNNSQAVSLSDVKVEVNVKTERDYGGGEQGDRVTGPHHSSSSHLVPECIEELTRTAEPPVPQMVEETACAVEAINSQDLVDQLFSESQVDAADMPRASKIKVQQGETQRHVIEIDNRSSTPILHIPSPKSETPPLPIHIQPESPTTITIVQSHTPQPIIINSGSSSKPNSRPPSRTHSRPPSRQPSQPNTPLSRPDTIILDSYDVTSQLNRLSALQESGGSCSSSEKQQTSVPPICISPIISPVVTTATMTTSSSKHHKSIFSSSSVPFKEKKNIPCKDRVYDPERHCGAWVADSGRNCTRSLTCKTHALSVRRAVQGRSKSFDQLLLEHRGAKEAEALRKAKASSESATSKGLSRIVMATKTVSTTTTTTVMSNCNTKLGKQTSQQSSVVKQPVTNILTYSHTPKPAVFPLLSRGRPLPLPVPLGGHVTSEGEEEEEGEALTYPCLQHHPRPAAVNSWGSRQYGRGCYTFNQRCDLIRSAFSSLVDTHNQSPPHKKLCLDPKLSGGHQHSSSAGNSGTQDPYDFSFGDSGHHSNSSVLQQTSAVPINTIHSTNSVHGSLIAKHKSKASVNLLHKSVRHKDHSAVDSRSSGSSNNSKHSSSGSASSLNSSNNTSKTILSSSSSSSSLKRKRSGSTVTVAQTTTPNLAQVATVSVPTFSSPLSITIPAGISLAALNNATLNNTLKAQAAKNNLNIVVSKTPGDQHHHQTGTFTNGQLLNLPAGINLDVSQLSQLGNLTQATVSTQGHNTTSSNSDHRKPTMLQKVAAKGNNATTAKLIPTLQNRTLAQKAQPFQIEFGNGNAGSVMAALQSGTVVMDTTGQSQGTTFLTSSQVAGLPTTNSSCTNPGQQPQPATGIVLKKDGQLVNGVLPHTGSLQPKSMPLSINHLTSTAPSQSNATSITQIALASKLQGRNNSMSGSKLSSFPKSLSGSLKPAMATLKPAMSSQMPLSRAGPQIAATINLSQAGSGRFLGPTAGNLQQVYANQVISPLQLQPKASAITNPISGAKTQAAGTTATAKLLQPMSLTIVAPPGGIARPLLINSDMNSGKTPLGDVVSSPGSVT